MGYDITIWDSIVICHMRYHTGSPQNAREKLLQGKPTTLLRPKFCFGSLSLPSSCLVSRLAIFVVLLLSINWTQHSTDRTTSKHQPCPLTTRPATWVHDCLYSVFCFLSLSLFPSCYIPGISHGIGIEISQKCSRYWYRYASENTSKYENIALYTEKSRYDTEY